LANRFPCFLQASCRFPVSFILRPKDGDKTFFWNIRFQWHRIISQKIKLFTTTAVWNKNPTYWQYGFKFEIYSNLSKIERALLNFLSSKIIHTTLYELHLQCTYIYHVENCSLL
jgi:hypothetical protein